jgi:hypothetical protein
MANKEEPSPRSAGPSADLPTNHAFVLKAKRAGEIGRAYDIVDPTFHSRRSAIPGTQCLLARAFGFNDTGHGGIPRVAMKTVSITIGALTFYDPAREEVKGASFGVDLWCFFDHFLSGLSRRLRFGVRRRVLLPMRWPARRDK